MEIRGSWTEEMEAAIADRRRYINCPHSGIKGTSPEYDLDEGLKLVIAEPMAPQGLILPHRKLPRRPSNRDGRTSWCNWTSRCVEGRSFN